jgi:hypothetical protein
MERETATCVHKRLGVVCGATVFVDELPFSQRSRKGARIRPLCPKHLQRYQLDNVHKRTKPTLRQLETRDRLSKERAGKKYRKDGNKRAVERKKQNTPYRPHHLLHCILNKLIRTRAGGNKYFKVSGFADQDAALTWWDNKAKECGFAGGLDDHGPEPHQWTIGHLIPKYAYNGLDADELRKCWDIRNMTCISRSQNSAQGRNFDDSLVSPDIYPADWNRLPCTPARRAEILAQFAHQDQPPAQPLQ